ncbi:MAG: IS110 family transposase [Bacteroidales bacterium]|nr:IS110 family transposase [Bacteroidales bacterium]
MIARITRDEVDYLPDIQDNQEAEELNAVNRQREELVKEETRIKNRLHAKLIQINPEYKDRYGKLCNKGALKKIEIDFCKTKDILEKLVLQDVKLLKNIIEEIKNLEKMLLEKQKANPLIQNLTTMDGIDTITACKLVGIIGDIDKFKSPDKLASYAGIAPVEKSSGKSSKKFRNTRANRRLNTAFYTIALTQRRYNEIAKAYFIKNRMKGRPKSRLCIVL